MAERIGATLLCLPTEPANCELCGQKAELRPYGPNGENICRDCGNKDPEGTRARMIAALQKQLPGVTSIVAPNGMVLRPKHIMKDLTTPHAKDS